MSARPGHAGPMAAALALLALLGAGPSLGQGLTVGDIFRRPLIEGDRPQPFAPSPDGEWVAFVWNEKGERSPRDLWVVPAGGGTPRNLTRFHDPTPEAPRTARPWRPKKGEEPRRLSVTSFDWSPRSDFLVLAALGDLHLARLDGRLRRLTDTEAAEADPRLSPDGRAVAFESGGNAFLLALEAGDAPLLTQLTREEEGFALDSPIWSPAGGRLAAVRSNRKERIDLVVPGYLGEKVEGSKTPGGWTTQSLVVLEAVGGEPRVVDLGSEAPASLSGLRFSADGRRLLVDGLSRDRRTRTLHVVELAAPDIVVRLVYRETDPAWAYGGGDWLFAPTFPSDFSADGSRILFLSERCGFAQPWLVSVEGGEPVAIGAAAEASFETSWVAWAGPDTVVSLDNRGAPAERRLHLIDLAGGEARPLGETPGLNAQPALSQDRRLLVVANSRFDRPADLHALRLPAGRAVRLTDSVPAAFRRIDWVVPRPVALTAADGTALAAMVYEPRGPRPPEGRPAVIFAHGAGYLQNVVDGWTIYSPNYKFHTVLAGKGYVVLEVDYRGSAGYGRDFRVAVHKQLGGKDLEDLVTAARWLRQRGDVGRIGVYGGSYGGFLALMALFRAGEHFDAGAALRFVADWENYHRGNPEYCTERLGDPVADREAYRTSSPIHYAEGLEDPLLLLHGVQDSNVHFQDAVQLTSRLIDLGKRFELMIYPREGHGFQSPESWIDEYERIEAFFERSLRSGERSAPGP